MPIDYRDLRGETKPAEEKHLRWWSAEEDDIAAGQFATVESIVKNQTALETQRQISARLYGNLSPLGLTGVTVQRGQLATSSPVRDRVSYNVVQSVIDTKVSRIAKNKPRPLFLTSGGDYREQRKAQKLTKFTDGMFHEARMRELAPLVFRDAEVAGTGIAHVFIKDKRVRIERVNASEIIVDDVEAFFGNPRQMHRTKHVDREVLAAEFPKSASYIETANAAKLTEAVKGSQVADQLQVIESWHLPSGPKAKDGLHAISIDGCCLFSEAWEYEFFPFAVLHSQKRLWGFWGQGAAERLQTMQLEINKILWLIQRTMHLGGTFKIAVEAGSDIAKQHLNNDIGTVITYVNQPPQYLTPPLVQPELYNHLQTLVRMAYEQEGISQMSAASKKPAGLDSGAALREHNDIESERFATQGGAYEQFHLDTARLCVEMAKRVYTSTDPRSYMVKVPGARFLETIDWKDIRLEDDAYVMQCFPVSSLPRDPAGRLQTIQEYIQAGLVDQRTGKRLLDFPDLEQVEGFANAVEERIIACLDAIVDTGEFTPPDPYMDLGLARELGLQYVNRYATLDLEEEKMEDLRSWLRQVDALEQKAMAQVAPPAPMAAPQAVAAPPPVSDLVPNVPAVQMPPA